MEQVKIFSSKNKNASLAAKEIEDHINDFLSDLPGLNGELIDIKTSMLSDAVTKENIFMAILIYEIIEDDEGCTCGEEDCGCSAKGDEEEALEK
jgi:hypothetical protein